MTFFGMKAFQKKKKEADGLSSLPGALVVPGVKTKEAAAALKGRLQLKTKLTEAEANPQGDDSDPSRFRVILIQEGLGNFGDCYFYTRGALESGIDLFEGAKCFANHPSETEEQDRPERDVKDIIGHFEGVHVEEADDGHAMMVADLVVMPEEPFDYARALMRHSVEYSKKYPDQDFIGLSINANGDATETGLESFISQSTLPKSVRDKLDQAVEMGITAVKPVQKLTSAVSCDLVTEAGAGGRVAQMLEQERSEMFKKKVKESAEDKKETEAKKEGDAPDPKKDGAKPDPKDQDGDNDGDADDQKESKEDAKDGDGDKGDSDSKDQKDGDGDDQSDADKDHAKMKSMLQKYVGGDDHDESTVKMAKEAYEAAKGEMGMDEDEAMKCAGYSMKMAKHMASKQEKKEAEAESKKEGEAKKLESQVIKLTAENSKLKESLKVVELTKFLDKTLQESKLPMSATKKFRECLGTPKSEDDVREKFKIFMEAYGAKSGEADLLEGFVIPEKTNNLRETGGIDLSGCVKAE